MGCLDHAQAEQVERHLRLDQVIKLRQQIHGADSLVVLVCVEDGGKRRTPARKYEAAGAHALAG